MVALNDRFHWSYMLFSVLDNIFFRKKWSHCINVPSINATSPFNTDASDPNLTLSSGMQDYISPAYRFHSKQCQYFPFEQCVVNSWWWWVELPTTLLPSHSPSLFLMNPWEHLQTPSWQTWFAPQLHEAARQGENCKRNLTTVKKNYTSDVIPPVP